MSCKSGIYAVNTAQGVALPVGATYIPNTIIRRFGQCCQLGGNGISILSQGYYGVDAIATVTATEAGTITATLMQDGVPVLGATTSVTAAVGDEVVLPISAMARLNCGCDTSNLTVVLSGIASTSVNLTFRVEKI